MVFHLSACIPLTGRQITKKVAESIHTTIDPNRPTPQPASCPTEEILVYDMEESIGISPQFAYDPDNPEWDKTYTEYTDINTIGVFSVDIVDDCVVNIGITTRVNRESGNVYLADAYEATVASIATKEFIDWWLKKNGNFVNFPILTTEKSPKTGTYGNTLAQQLNIM